MVGLADHFLGPRAAGADPLRSSGGGSAFEESAIANDVDRAASDVERARDATNSAVALSRAAPGGNNQLRMSGQEASQVEISMRDQPPSRCVARGARHAQTVAT